MKITQEQRDYFQKLGYSDDDISRMEFKDIVGDIRNIKAEERTVTAVISSDVVDRMSEVMDPEGADLRNYRKNPVVLWAHQYREPPIAKSLWVKKSGHEVIAKIQFATTQFAQEIYELFKGGFLRAFSVGFIPREVEDGKEHDKFRRKITKWELVEHSVVPVPANPDALALAVKTGEVKLSNGLKEKMLGKDNQDIDFDTLDVDTLEFDDFEMKPAPDVTEEYIRWRIRNPDLFKSLRTIWFSESQGIRAITGRLKDDDGSTHVQAVLFVKSKWTVERARKWIEEHRDELKDIKEEIEPPPNSNTIDNALDTIEMFEAELKQKDEEIEALKKDIANLTSEIKDWQYKIYQLTVTKEKKQVSEMSDDELTEKIGDLVIRGIKHATGKVS